jgi:hypothetical protein
MEAPAAAAGRTMMARLRAQPAIAEGEACKRAAAFMAAAVGDDP